MKLVKIVWNDSILDTSGWADLDTYDFNNHLKSMRMETVGYLIKATDEAVFVAQTVANNQIASVVSIPSGCIKSIRKLNKTFKE